MYIIKMRNIKIVWRCVTSGVTAIFSKFSFYRENRALILGKNVQNLALEVNPGL